MVYLGKLTIFIATITMTAPPQSTPFKFFVIGDTQQHEWVLTKAAYSMQKQSAEFGIHLGDVNWCYAKARWNRAKLQLGRTGVPWYMVIGNHELRRCGVRYLRGRYSWLRKKFSQFWLNGGDTFQHYIHHDKHIVILDSADYKVPLYQVLKLELILKRAAEKSVLLFLHHPPASAKNFRVWFSPKMAWEPFRRLDGMRYVRANKKLTKLIVTNKAKMMAIFHGHHHAYRSYQLEGIPVYCSGGGGGALEYHRDFYHYLHVEINGPTLDVKVIRVK